MTDRGAQTPRNIICGSRRGGNAEGNVMSYRMLSTVLMMSLCTGALCAEQRNLCYTRSGDQRVERYVSVRYLSDDTVPCEVVYEKPTEGKPAKVIAQAQNTRGFCERKANELIKVLTNAGYTCDTPATDATAPAPTDDTPALQDDTSVMEPATEDPAPTEPQNEPEAAEGSARVTGTPQPLVISYLHFLRERADEDSRMAVDELERIEQIGLGEFYDGWNPVLKDLNGDRVDELLVESMRCQPDNCTTFVLERSAQRADDGHYKLRTILVVPSRLVESLYCQCEPGEWRPIVSYVNRSGLMSIWSVYEYRDNVYQARYTCSYSETDEGSEHRWIRSDWRDTGPAAGGPIEKGSCGEALEAAYEDYGFPPGLDEHPWKDKPEELAALPRV